jgi:hypothetical protein
VGGIVKAYRDEVIEALEAANDSSGEAPLTSWKWLLHYADREPMTVSFNPEATHGEVLVLYPKALAAEPVVPDAGQSAAPMTGGEEALIRSWLESIGEDDPVIVDETLERCRQDAGARNYFLGQVTTKAEPDGGLSCDEAESVAWNEEDRRRCVHCLNLLPNGICQSGGTGRDGTGAAGIPPKPRMATALRGVSACAGRSRPAHGC